MILPALSVTFLPSLIPEHVEQGMEEAIVGD